MDGNNTIDSKEVDELILKLAPSRSKNTRSVMQQQQVHAERLWERQADARFECLEEKVETIHAKLDQLLAMAKGVEYEQKAAA